MIRRAHEMARVTATAAPAAAAPPKVTRLPSALTAAVAASSMSRSRSSPLMVSRVVSTWVA